MNLILPPFQIIGRFGFSGFIVFTTYLDIAYVYVHDKYYISRSQNNIQFGRREYKSHSENTLDHFAGFGLYFQKYHLAKVFGH